MSLKLKWRGGIAYIHGTIDGKRIRKSLGTRDPQIAEARRAQEEAREWRAATYGIENEATFADACLLYLKHRPPRDHYLAKILPKIGRMKLAKITAGQVRMLASQLYPDAKPQTRNRQVLVPVSAVINFAHEAGMCAPIRIKAFTPFDQKHKRAIDREWLDRFRAHASQHMAACALFLHTTAARTTEALLLRPQDIDLQNGRGHSRMPTKNGARREFWLTRELVDELKRLPPLPIRRGAYKGELRLFGWHSKSAFWQEWVRTVENAGLDYVTPHEAGRHSFATEAITRQERNPVMVAKIGNWKSAHVLMRNYAHPENPEAFVEEVYGAKVTQNWHSAKRKTAK